MLRCTVPTIIALHSLLQARQLVDAALRRARDEPPPQHLPVEVVLGGGALPFYSHRNGRGRGWFWRGSKWELVAAKIEAAPHPTHTTHTQAVHALPAGKLLPSALVPHHRHHTTHTLTRAMAFCATRFPYCRHALILMPVTRAPGSVNLDLAKDQAPRFSIPP